MLQTMRFVVVSLAVLALLGGSAHAAQQLPEPVVDSVREARTWMHVADTALVHDQWLIAYEYYDRVLKTFPGTLYAKQAESRQESLRYRLTRPGRLVRTGTNWLQDVWEFVVWP